MIWLPDPEGIEELGKMIAATWNRIARRWRGFIMICCGAMIAAGDVHWLNGAQPVYWIIAIIALALVIFGYSYVNDYAYGRSDQ